jgi:hypothetical protein
MQESFVLESLRSDSLSLVQKITLVRDIGSDRCSEAVKATLKAEKAKVFDSLDARGMVKFLETSNYDFSEYDLVPKLNPGSLTTEEVLSILTTWPYISVQGSLVDALMKLVDWKSIPKNKLVRKFYRNHSDRLWKKLVLEFEVFSEAELLELLTGHWNGSWLKHSWTGPHAPHFRRIVLSSPLVSKTEKMRVATETGPINAEEYFKVVLEHMEFNDQELIDIADSGRVAKCWTLIHPCLKKYRTLLKVARLLKKDSAWDVFIERANLATKTPRQILRVARISGYPKIWSLYFEKATEPAVTHEELMKRGAKAGRYALWAVLLAHVDYSKLTLEWITSFIRGCANATANFRACRSYNQADDRRFNFDAAMVIAKKVDWKSVPYAERVELLKVYPCEPWREVLAMSFDKVQMKDVVRFAGEQHSKFLEILQAKAV